MNPSRCALSKLVRLVVLHSRRFIIARGHAHKRALASKFNRDIDIHCNSIQTRLARSRRNPGRLRLRVGFTCLPFGTQRYPKSVSRI